MHDSFFHAIDLYLMFVILYLSLLRLCVCCVCVNICVNVCVQKMFLPKCGKIPSWVQNSSFQQQVTVSASELRPESKQHLATLATLAALATLAQLQCFCLIRSRGILSVRQTAGLNWSGTKCKICIFPFWIWFHFQFSWRSARNAKSVFTSFEFGFISSSLEGRREMQLRLIHIYCLDNIFYFCFPCKTHFMTKLSSCCC